MTEAEGAGRPLRIAVVGPGEASADERRRARALGRALAEAGAVVLTGGLGGVMEAASGGASEAGGRVVGVLPGDDPSAANAGVDLPLATGLGEARNVLLVRFAEGVVAVGGRWGTLSEVALAARRGTPVALLAAAPLGLSLPLPRFDTAADAARWVLREARERRPAG